jgi:hypothetical protein
VSVKSGSTASSKIVTAIAQDIVSMQSSHQAGAMLVDLLATQDALAISVSRANMRTRFAVVEMQ